MKQILGFYDQMYYNTNDADDSLLQNGISSHETTSDENSNSDQELVIPQMDGLEDIISSGDEEIEDKNQFAVNCDRKEVINIMNIFRSFDMLWESLKGHTLCDVKNSCFFCYFRSACLRLSIRRKKGPKSLKMNELVSQLYKFEDQLGHDWRNVISDVPAFCHKTIEQLKLHENATTSYFGIPGG